MIRIISSTQREKIRELREKLSINEGLVTKSSAALTKKVFGKPLKPIEVVRKIISDIRAEGDKALIRYASALEGSNFSTKEIEVPRKELDRAYKTVDKDLLAAMKKAKENIIKFQSTIKYSFARTLDSQGMRISLMVNPMERVGIYIPGGTATYPSSVLMNALPARCAGVREIILSTPANKEGKISDAVLAAAKLCEVDHLYRIGGVQAIAAMALGTASIPKVDKIAGPGNLFVALAKKELYGHVDIDMIAGPSEVLVYADESTPSSFTALDLMAQAEHYPGSAVLLTRSRSYAQAVIASLEKEIKTLSRGEKIREDLAAYSLIVLVKDDKDALDLINSFGPEHLQLMVRNNQDLLKNIRNAGAIFVGPQTPVAFGDYFAGPSHTLPTGGTSRFYSGVNVNSFLRTTAVMEAKESYGRQFGKLISSFANAEGLTAHAESVLTRMAKTPNKKK